MIKWVSSNPIKSKGPKGLSWWWIWPVGRPDLRIRAGYWTMEDVEDVND